MGWNYNCHDNHLVANSPVSVLYLDYYPLYQDRLPKVLSMGIPRLDNVMLLRQYVFFLLGRNQGVGFQALYEARLQKDYSQIELEKVTRFP